MELIQNSRGQSASSPNYEPTLKAMGRRGGEEHRKFGEFRYNPAKTTRLFQSDIKLIVKVVSEC